MQRQHGGRQRSEPKLLDARERDRDARAPGHQARDSVPAARAIFARQLVAGGASVRTNLGRGNRQAFAGEGGQRE